MNTEHIPGQINIASQSISNPKLFKIIDEMLEGVQIFDKHLNYIYINKAAEKQNQRKKEELLGKSYEESWPGIEKTIVYKIIRQCLIEQKNTQFENEFVFPDGSKGWFLLSIQAIDEGLLILSLDITSRMILGQEIAHKEKLYHSLFENLLNGFSYCKMEFQDGKPVDYYFISVNKAFEKLTGLQNVIGRKVTEIIPGIMDTDRQLLMIFGRVVQTGISETFEIFLNSLHMWFYITVYSPEKDHFVSIFDVITERKNAESKLHEQLEELQRWYSATIDREQRTIELKKEINELMVELGKAPKYSMINEVIDQRLNK